MKKQFTVALSLFIAASLFANVQASDFDDFDGKENSQEVIYVERVAPAGTVPVVQGSSYSVGMPQQTEMMAEPEVDESSQPAMTEQEAEIWRANTTRKFKAANKRAGSPNIAVFWNREFSDQLSQWYADKRVVKTGEQSNKSSDKFEPSNKASGKGYNRNQTGGSKIVEAQYFAECKEAIKMSVSSEKGYNDKGRINKLAGSAEVNPSPELCYQVLDKRPPAGDSMGDKSKNFEFNSGYMSPFLGSSAKMIDRSSIMRIVQRENAQKAGAELISDAQKLETDALVGYADYIAEIVYKSKSKTQLGVEFLVTVKEISSGRIVAMFKTDGTPADLPADSSEWEAGPNGYRKVDASSEASAYDVGQQLAYETMEALAKAW